MGPEITIDRALQAGVKLSVDAARKHTIVEGVNSLLSLNDCTSTEGKQLFNDSDRRKACPSSFRILLHSSRTGSN